MTVTHNIWAPQFDRLVVKAIKHGALIDGYTIDWSCEGKCSKPLEVLLKRDRLRMPVKRRRGYAEDGPSFVSKHGDEWFPANGMTWNYSGHRYVDRLFKFLRLWLMCKKCPQCREHRRKTWAKRATVETVASPRTWMITLTLGDGARFKISQDDSLLGKWFTKYMKRVRKEAKAKLRFFMVVEKHKDGTPHVHALIHETEGRVLWRTLHDQWFDNHGFFEGHLVRDARHAGKYVSKYLSKDLDVRRVRASIRYGKKNNAASDGIAQ